MSKTAKDNVKNDKSSPMLVGERVFVDGIQVSGTLTPIDEVQLLSPALPIGKIEFAPPASLEPISRNPSNFTLMNDFPVPVGTPLLVLKVKKLSPDAIIPKRATDGSACWDLSVPASSFAEGSTQTVIHSGEMMTFDLHLAFEVPKGYVMLVYSRSGHGFNNNVRLANCVGVVDSDYRGMLRVRLVSDGGRPLVVKSGDRIAQAMLVAVPEISLIEVETLSDTARGEGGYGSTGSCPL
jgi:dUTP pyrophosphatase